MNNSLISMNTHSLRYMADILVPSSSPNNSYSIIKIFKAFQHGSWVNKRQLLCLIEMKCSSHSKEVCTSLRGRKMTYSQLRNDLFKGHFSSWVPRQILWTVRSLVTYMGCRSILHSLSGALTENRNPKSWASISCRHWWKMLTQSVW